MDENCGEAGGRRAMFDVVTLMLRICSFHVAGWKIKCDWWLVSASDHRGEVSLPQGSYNFRQLRVSHFHKYPLPQQQNNLISLEHKLLCPDSAGKVTQYLTECCNNLDWNNATNSCDSRRCMQISPLDCGGLGGRLVPDPWSGSVKSETCNKTWIIKSNFRTILQNEDRVASFKFWAFFHAKISFHHFSFLIFLGPQLFSPRLPFFICFPPFKRA